MSPVSPGLACSPELATRTQQRRPHRLASAVAPSCKPLRMPRPPCIVSDAGRTPNATSRWAGQRPPHGRRWLGGADAGRKGKAAARCAAKRGGLSAAEAGAGGPDESGRAVALGSRESLSVASPNLGTMAGVTCGGRTGSPDVGAKANPSACEKTARGPGCAKSGVSSTPANRRSLCRTTGMAPVSRCPSCPDHAKDRLEIGELLAAL